MSETMYDCYVSQFDCLKRALANRDEIVKNFAGFYKKINPDRIYLVGSGTSFHACDAASFYMEELLGVEVSVVAATLMGNVRGKRPLVIAVSQSGLSTNTRALVQRLRAGHVPVATLTEPLNTPVSEAAAFPILLQADNEKIGPKTRGYAVTVLTLYLMALEVCTGQNAGIAKITALTESGPQYLEAVRTFYETHKDALAKARSYIFTGKNAAAKVANECALKVLETVCYPALGYEYEEFLHGPAFSIDEDTAVFHFLCDGEDKARMLKSASFISRATQNSYIISHDINVQGEKILYLPATEPEVFSPFVHVLPGQLISSLLPEYIGRGRHPAVKDILREMDTKVKV
jgi:glucoselysine-6-phosphate deglycase